MIVRTERDIKYRSMSAMLRDAGYVSIGKPLIQPYRLFGILMIACNVIGEMLEVHPYRVYLSLYVRVTRAIRGVNHLSFNSKYIRAQGHQDAEELHVYCPCCGQDLLAAGPPTMEEIAEGKARAAAMRRKSTQKSPQSSENEGRISPSVGIAAVGGEVIGGAGGTGGGDPTGAGSPTVPPHSPRRKKMKV